jgi:hypothetical protein
MQDAAPLTLDATFVASPDALFKPLDGEGVLLDLANGIYFGLDATGTRLWQLLQEHRSLRRAYDAMLAEYEVPPDRLREDLLAFVGDLARRSLASVTHPPPPSR